MNLSRRLAKLEGAEQGGIGRRFLVLWEGIYSRPTDAEIAQATKVWEVKIVHRRLEAMQGGATDETYSQAPE